MKKIIIFSRGLGCGGSEKALISLLKAIDYREYDVTLKLLDREEFYLDEVPSQVKISYFQFKHNYDRAIVSWNLDYVRSIRNFVGRLKRKYYSIKNQEERYGRYKTYINMLKYVEKNNEKYDIALDFFGYGYFFTVYLAKCINAERKATWIHDERLDWLSNVEECLADYDKVFCVSNACKSAFSKKYPQYKEQTEVFYNLTDVDAIIEKAEEALKDCNYTGSMKILTVGRLAWQKGYDIAIDVVAELVKRNLDFRWYVIGDGEEADTLKRQVSKMEIGDYFIFLGRKENPYPYIKQCDLYIQPSRHEGYCTTIVEAKVLNKAIIASKIESFSEQIADGKNGYLVALDVMEIADKIQQLIENPQMREKVVAGLKKEAINFMGELQKLERLL